MALSVLSNGLRLGRALATFLDARPPLRWIKTRGVSIASVVSALVTLFLFRRGVEYFPLFLGYLLFLWLAAVVFVGVRGNLGDRTASAVTVAIDYTVQTLLHGLLLFLVPIYYASSTLASGNVWLLFLLIAAVILTTFDPWYRAVRARAPWAELALFWIGLFASLSVAFPLIGLPSEISLPLSGCLSVLLLMPACRQYVRIPWASAALYTTTGAVVLTVGVWWTRTWIPPVPLHLSRATFAHAVERLAPLEPVARILTSRLRDWGRLVAFTAITAPSGLAEPVYHVWRKNGQTVDQMLLSTVRGGRPGGFRTYSWKTDLGSDPAGRWVVDVRTVHGQLIGRVRLLVTAP